MSADERPISERPMERVGERRGAARTAVVWDALRERFERAGPPDHQEGDRPSTLRVLDIGGGTGGFAVRVAQLGHRVTVVDPSPDALASLGRRARELGVEVTGIQGDLEGLAGLVDVVEETDVVLCHGVLEVVEDPAAALARIRDVLRPGGVLSLLVAQRHAAVIARAMAGHFTQARALLDQTAPQGRAGRRFTAAEAAELVEQAGFEVTSTHGVRVFADLVPGSLLDLEPGATAALVDLEREAATRPEYLPLAMQVHLLAQ